MKTIAIITARGGSKRVPRKNVKELLGKPLLCYSVEAALAAGCFDEVMVSTDDEEIAQIARRAGASVPFFRSEETSGDFATTSDVLREVLLRYEELGKQFEAACCLYPTAPFLTGERLRDAMQRLLDGNADTVMSVVRFSFPPQRGMLLEDGCLRLQYPEYRNARSQDLPPVYHDCGQFYCFRTEPFLKSGNIIGDTVLPYILPETEVQDIDTQEDFELAELKLRRLREKGGRD
ncbi:MAG: pseudaminic acid cytidylyltransferase [Lachnospiraceae bacterium]|nr:pseudaminic acid cytidylyltransferase [Lachnospiraceae bacterium]